MGQIFGKATLHQHCRRFSDLPRSRIYDIWEAYSELSEVFSLSLQEFQEILSSSLLTYLGVSEQLLHQEAEELFRLYDTDKNGYIDALEFLASFAILSGMTTDEKIAFIFAMFDFDESFELAPVETTLAFQRTLSGLAKLTGIIPPQDRDIEDAVVLGFERFFSSKTKRINEFVNDGEDEVDVMDEGLQKTPFTKLCLDTPEIVAWIEFFDDLHMDDQDLDVAPTSATTGPQPIRHYIPPHYKRNDFQSRYMNPSAASVDLDPEDSPLEEFHASRGGSRYDVLPSPAPHSELEEPGVANEFTDMPVEALELNWAYGFNGHSSRQTLYYSARGALVYPAGAVVVIHDAVHNMQSHFTCHNDLITCLKVFHDDKGDTVVASGECGKQPVVLVWECDTRKVLSALRGFHTNAVIQLDFSPDRVKLVTLGMDKYYCLAVYDWRKGVRLWSARTSLDAVHDVHFLSDRLIASCGRNHVTFWSQKVGGTFSSFRGLFGAVAEKETMWCVSSVGDNVVTGSESGRIYLWEGRNLLKGIKAHEGRVNAMYLVSRRGEETGLVTVCSAGMILIWNTQVEIRATFSTESLNSMERSIVSVCWDTVMQKLLLGFRSCEIYEMNSAEGRNAHFTSVVAAHYNVKVMHVATHPRQEDIFCSVGADRTVRVYDSKLHRQVGIRLFDCMVKCATFSPNGKMLFVGLGVGIPGLEENKEGAHLILNPSDLSTIYDSRDSTQQITDIKVDPLSRTYAVSSLDGSIFIYDLRDYSMRNNCRGHRGGVIHLDYSTTGKYIRSNCTHGDLVFWDVQTGFPVPSHEMGDVEWHTQTCIYTRDVQGIWTYDDLDYHYVSRSHNQKTIATVDSCGFVKIFLNPCRGHKPNHVLAKAHAANALCVEYTCNDKFLLSTGGLDGCVFQWAVRRPDVATSNPLSSESGFAVDITHLLVEMSFDGDTIIRSAAVEKAMRDNMDAVCWYEELGAERPQQEWRDIIVHPSKLLADDNIEPLDYLELDSISGFACDRFRDSLLYTRSGYVAFFSAAVGGIMDTNTQRQTFYMDHTSTITAMAMHPREDIVATGEVGERPAVRVWDTITKNTLVVLEGFHTRAIQKLGFSANGSLLAVLGGDMHHTVTVYLWEHRQVVARSLTYDVKTFYLAFSPSDSYLLQCGDGLVRFWTMDGLNMKFQDAVLTVPATRQPFLCAAWSEEDCALVGTADGHLYIFNDYVVEHIIMAHDGTVNAVVSTGGKICTGGSDGVVKVWRQSDLECIMVIDVNALAGGRGSDVRCVDVFAEKDSILIGTIAKEIFEVNASTGVNLHDSALMEGHSGEELWGLGVHPLDTGYCTVGDDGILRVWKPDQACSVMSKSLHLPARSCTYSPNGQFIAVGTVAVTGPEQQQSHIVHILDAENLESTSQISSIASMVTVLRYSPDGVYLAAGCLDGQVHFFLVDQGYSFAHTSSGLLSYIAHIDFSVDSQHMRVNGGEYEVAYYECSHGQKVDDITVVQDLHWATHNCTLTWTVQGAWPPYEDGTVITCSDSTPSVIVTGDNYGRVQLFKQPALSFHAMSRKYKPASTAVTDVRFVSSGTHLISVNGFDNSIFKWRCLRDSVSTDINAATEPTVDDEIMTLSCVSRYSSAVTTLRDDDSRVGAKMWIRTLVEPTDTSAIDSLDQLEPPEIITELSHIFGLAAEHTRGMTRYNLDGDIVYPSSKYISVYSKRTNRQVIYREHKNEVCCFTVSADGRIAASAEGCSRPAIHLWDACTTRVVKVLPVLHRRGVVCMQFSADGTLLLSVGKDQDRSIALWESLSGEWTDARLRAWGKGGIHDVVFASFYQYDSLMFASGGDTHIKFWTVCGRCLNSLSAILNAEESNPGNILCGTANGSVFISGSSTGSLHVWTGRILSRVIRAHNAAVRAMWSDGNTLATASKDGTVKLWNAELAHSKTISLVDTDLPSFSYGLVSVDCITDRSTKSGISTMLLATSAGDICEVSVYSESMTLIQESHTTGELWGLAMHPFDPDLFATSGDDGTVRVWSIIHKRVLRKAVLDCTSRCVGWSPDAKLIIAGFGGNVDSVRQRKDGGFVVFEAATMTPIFEGRDAKGWITDIKFNPVYSTFAMGSMDNKIYIYNRERMRLKGTCSKHKGYIREFDFSEDGKYIQSDASDYEKLYFEAEDGEFFTGSSFLKDVKWVHGTSVFGWHVLGVWPYEEDIANGVAAEPSCMQRSPDGRLIVVGDLTGAVRLHKYPCVRKESIPCTLSGHIGEVAKARFTCDNRYVVTMGKTDKSILLWKIKSK